MWHKQSTIGRSNLPRRDERFRAAYRLFLRAEKSRKEWTVEALCDATGWKPSTVNAYVSKKWTGFLAKGTLGYFVKGISDYTEDEFCRLSSQTNVLSQDPQRPDYPEEVQSLIAKARQAAILAVDMYNRPAVEFRTEGFTVMMVIAWRSILHAHFKHKGICFFYTENDGTVRKIDGEEKAWELAKCVKEYFGPVDNAVHKNLEFMIGLRNRIEHRFVPALDLHVAGECQAMLLNFEDFMVKEFGHYYSIRDSLALALQTSSARSVQQASALKKSQLRHYRVLKEYLQVFRDQLTPEIYSDPKYSVRFFLVPKTGNHESSSDAAMEFVRVDPDDPAQVKEMDHPVTLIREKHVPVNNPGTFKPKDVVEQIQNRTGRKFRQYEHINAWKMYRVRGPGKCPGECKTEYCQYDAAHGDYVYTKKWVEFLADKVSDSIEYERIKNFGRKQKHQHTES